SPVQQRNLEKHWQAKVIDRTGLILEIFGARARTHEGRLQVELAALSYQRSRLVRSWTHLERQRGGFGFLGGPGESQLEIDRRLIGERIARLKRELDDVKRTRALHREARRRVPYPVVALIGYTNAGKSTLFNRLTRSSVAAGDMLFATLDPTMRRLELLSVLAGLGLVELAGDGLVEAMNKIDLIDPATRAGLANQALRNSHTVALSAVTGEGCAALLTMLDHRLESDIRPVRLDVP